MPTHYQALSVRAMADLATIRKAYHQVSLLHHPDRTLNLSAPERAQREQLFKLANAAFEVLSDHRKRKAYDQSLGINGTYSEDPDNTFSATPLDNRKPKNGNSATNADGRHNGREEKPSHPNKPRSEGPNGYGGPRSVQRTPISSHRFTTTALGTPPDNHWYYSEVVEKSDHTTIVFSNWLRWNFVIGISNRFTLSARPILPEKQQAESIIIRLPLHRTPRQSDRTPTDMFVSLRSVPGSQHTVLCSTLVERPEKLELIVELMFAPVDIQKEIEGPVLWKWNYHIEQEPSLMDMEVKAISLVFQPLRPSYVAMSNGGMPGLPYPVSSPMFRLREQYPGIRIDDSAPHTYCAKEEQHSKEFWRLAAVGSL